MEKWMAKGLVFVLLASMVLFSLPASAESASTSSLTSAQQAQVDILLKQFGFETMEEAMELNGVETPEALLALALTGKLVAKVQEAEATDTTEPEAAEPDEERTFDGKVLATMEMAASAEEIKYFFQEQLGIPIADFLTFPTVTEALMALKTGKVDTLLSMDATANLIAKQDATLYTYIDPRLANLADVSLSMVVARTNEALGAELNTAIHALEENGTLALLAGSMLGGEAPAVPEAKLEGDPLRVGVTGDIPPVDFVDASGNPVGYNVNLMNQVGALLGRPIEFVQINKGAAITALATNRIDILFWQEQAMSEDVIAMVGDLSKSVFITDPYLKMSVTAIEMK